jgi:hypothetical protein
VGLNRNIKGKFDIVEKDISQLKQSVNIHDQRLNINDQDMRGFHHRISELEGARDELSVLTPMYILKMYFIRDV